MARLLPCKRRATGEPYPPAPGWITISSLVLICSPVFMSGSLSAYRLSAQLLDLFVAGSFKCGRWVVLHCPRVALPDCRFRLFWLMVLSSGYPIRSNVSAEGTGEPSAGRQYPQAHGWRPNSCPSVNLPPNQFTAFLFIPSTKAFCRAVSCISLVR